jgi:citrate lyase subunit beta / citryl-CoA lyase
VRRSKLITPALRHDLLEKAAASGADIIHIELEDGVPDDQKTAARESALSALREIAWDGREVWVRINTPGSDDAARDIERLVAGAPHAFLIPKVSGPQDIADVARLVSEAERAQGIPEGRIALAAVIERIRALDTVEQIAAADRRMIAIVLGTEDLSVEYGYRLDRTGCGLETLYLKSRCILAARLAGIDCIDAPYFHYRDLDGTRRAAVWAAQLGFTGKTCLSPRQVPMVNEAFAPTAEEIAWATEVLAALDKAATKNLSVAVANGMMVDAPHALQARWILQRVAGREPNGGRDALAD